MFSMIQIYREFPIFQLTKITINIFFINSDDFLKLSKTQFMTMDLFKNKYCIPYARLQNRDNNSAG